jgi:hypothetical protein
MKRLLSVAAIVWTLPAGLLASEYRGVVKCGGLPFPGATVTATHGDRKVVTTTDGKGAFRFADLADGVWTIDVEMVGFEKASKEVGVAPDAPSPEYSYFSSWRSPPRPRSRRA